MNNIFTKFLKNPFRRKAHRSKIQCSVKMTPIKTKRHWTQSQYIGIATDLSANGIRISTNAPIELKDIVRLEFSLQTSTKVIQVRAIARVLHSQLNKCEIGFAYLDPDPAVVRYLKAILILYNR